MQLKAQVIYELRHELKFIDPVQAAAIPRSTYYWLKHQERSDKCQKAKWPRPYVLSLFSPIQFKKPEQK